MKKAYHAPALYYESFQLAQNISAGCEGIANFEDNGCTIYITDLGFSIYADTAICNYVPPNGDDTICYHAPSEMNNAFSS
ncbi:MAG: hypothetical protein IJJ99_00675 [Oscillospiraceae bacterium]|nr:hypothetical protein [Oscillospiraceae bacterium]